MNVKEAADTRTEDERQVWLFIREAMDARDATDLPPNADLKVKALLWMVRGMVASRTLDATPEPAAPIF